MGEIDYLLVIMPIFLFGYVFGLIAIAGVGATKAIIKKIGFHDKIYISSYNGDESGVCVNYGNCLEYYAHDKRYHIQKNIKDMYDFEIRYYINKMERMAKKDMRKEARLSAYKKVYNDEL